MEISYFKSLVQIDHSMDTFKWMVNQNDDTFDGIKSLRFATEDEAALAATLWLNIPEDQREKKMNEFRYILKFTLRIIGNTESEWAK